MILVSFAGTRDPIADDTREEGSIVTLCRYLASEGDPVTALWVLSMDAVGQTHAAETREWLTLEGLLGPDQIHLVHHDGDPVNHIAVTQFAFAAVQGVPEAAEVEERLRIAFNGTSGTPAMKMSGFLLSIAGLLHGGSVWTVANPTLVADTMRVTPVQMDFVREHLLREQIRTAVQGSQFGTALTIASEWKNATVHEDNRHIADPVGHVLRAYQAQDVANYAEAKIHMEQIPEAQVFTNVTAQTEFLAQRRWLQKPELSAATENPYNLVEIFCAIARYQTQERYTDALARGRRLFEGIVYWYYQAHCQIDVRQTVDTWEPVWRKRMNRDDINGTKPTLWVLADGMFTCELDAAQAKEWQGKKRVLRQMMDLRNRSLAAHGMQPVTKSHVDAVYPIIKDLLVTMVPGTADYIRDYPLTPTKRRRVLEGLGL